MKKFICMLLMLMLLTGAACAETMGNRLGFELLRTLGDGTKNQVISPLSLSMALSMAAQGADGETKQQILDALEITIPEEAPLLLESMVETGLRHANAAFITGEMTPEAEYVSDLEQLFGAAWFDPEHSGVKSINRWVKDMTDGMIPSIIERLPEEIQLVLINAIAMDEQWQIPFDPMSTYSAPFFSPDGEAMVEMMHNTFRAAYGEREGVQLLRLGYRDSSLAMYIALPEEDGMSTVLDGLCAEGMDYFTLRDERVKVALSMPKVDIAAGNDLSETLKKLGIELAFDNNADFSGISKDMQLKVGSVIQKARLIMDEEGTRAAAATAICMEVTGAYMPEEIIEFNMDHPFVIVIADEASGAVCFAGIVANPMGN